MRDFRLWNEIKNLLEKNISTTLLLVTAIEGSTPGKQGFKMLLGENGVQIGTIGGGHMEHSLLEKCREMMKHNETKPIYLKKTHHESAPEEEHSGLICTGTQHLVLYKFKAADLANVNSIIDSYNIKSSNALLLSPDGFSVIKNGKTANKIDFHYENKSNWQYQEQVGNPNIVYIIGAGHVGSALSRIMTALDFYIVLFDHRSDLKLFNDNIYAHKKIPGPYEEVVNHINEGKQSYVVIVLPSFHSDALALGKLINKYYRYIGLLGSSAKLKYVFNEMNKLGISQEMIDRVHAPIGVPINNQSPEEIAISIAAELVDVKNSS